MKNIIIIATHKKYAMPEDDIYLPIHVGKYGKNDIGFIGDDSGDNISIKNPYYCELTGLYWAWKNLDADYIGLAHYRRHFSYKGYFYRFLHNKTKSIMTKKELDAFVLNNDIILPKKRFYIIETLYSHYINTHDPAHLEKTREIIASLYPEDLKYYDLVLKQRSGYMFNMFIMKRELLDSYCSWLFNILFLLESMIDSSKYSSFDKRYIGRISELLFNVWLQKQKEIKFNIRIASIPYIHIEKVDWYKKVKSFLAAKFFKKKYNGSF